MNHKWLGSKLIKKFDVLIRILVILIFIFPNLAMQYGSANAETNSVLQEETGTPSTPPTILVVGDLTDFSSIVDTPSEPQSYQVSGSALVSDLIITPPEGFQISLTNEDGFIDYPDTLTLTPASDGSLAETSVYVRLNASKTGQYSGDILHTSENAQEVALSVIGQVEDGSDKTPLIEETETPESLSATGSMGLSAEASTATTVNFTADEMLGKPTDTSITINVVLESSIVYKYQYGTSSGGYTGETAEVTATGGSPSETVISGLLPNTKYYYRMEYHIPSETEWATRTEHTFETQRSAGSSFVFTVTSDSHDQGTFTGVDNNILSEAPDFHIDLGDTFMVDNLTTQSAVDAKYLKIRGTGYFGNIGSSVPIFLSSGNHENEEGWNLDDTFSLAQASIQARKKYFPTPINASIYTGNTDPLSAIDASVYGDQYREDYYAWTWGDALFIVIDPFQYTMTNPYGSTAGEGSDDPASGDQWNWTLGQQQYDWLKSTLENSDAKYKFVFSHQMVGGKPTGDSSSPATYVRGGAEAAGYFEWGGKDATGTNVFSTKRPSMPKTIEQLFEDNGVSAYFHGHDHQYVYEKRSGIVYQEVPSPTMTGSGFNDYTEGTYTDYQTIKKLSSGGHLKITVTSTNATVDYISTGGAVNYSYTIDPAGSDTTPPTVTITQASGQTDPTSASPVNFSATFSESVSDFTSSDVTLSGTAGAATAVVTGSGSSYNVAVSGMTSSGTVIASINAGVAHDSSSNANTASINTDNTVTYSTSSSSGSVTLDGTVGSGGTASSGSSLSFSHTTGTGTNRLMLVGVSWNCGTAATPPSISSITFTYGSTVLNLSQEIVQQTNTTTVANKRYSAIWYSPTEPPAATTGTIKVTFSASVTSGIAANSANFAGVDLTTPFSTSNGAYSTSSSAPSVTLSTLNGNELIFDNLFVGGTTVPTVGSSQTKLWGVNGGNAISAASILQASSTSATMSWSSSSAVTWASAAVAINPGEDAIPPSVTINQATTQDDPTTAHTINFSVVFSEAVTDFATGDVTLSGSAGATTATVTGSGTTYNVAVTGMTTSGTVIVSLAAGVAHDSAGNASLASTSTDNQVSYVVDTTPPTVTINQASGQTDPASTPPVNFAVVFSEPVTDFATGDVTISGTASPTTATVTGSGTTYNVAVTGMTGSGTVIASLAAGVAHDEAGNPSAASSTTDNQVTYIYAVVTQDGAVSSISAASGSTLSFSHTTGTGSNRLMLVGVSWNCYTSDPAPTISTMNFTYGSTTLNLAQEIVQETNNGTASNKRYSAIWYSPTEPPSGTTGTVNITFTGSVTNGIAAGAANFAGVNQTTPFGTAVSAFATSGTAPTVSLTGLTGNELVFDNVFMGASSSSQTLAPAASSGQTQLWIPAYVANLRGSASTKSASGSTSVNMSWTANSSAAWAIAAVPIIPNVETISHTLEITASPSSGGTTSPTVGTHTYSTGTGVDITATPASGYEFTGWAGDCTGTGTCHVVMDADKSVTANFALITKALTVAVSPSGSGTTSPTVGTHTYTMGTGVDITATPASGYTFTGWSGACTGTGSCHVTMDDDKTVTANFETINKTLTVAVTPSGGGTTSPTAGTHTYSKGTGVDITATPASGYEFVGWSGDCSGTGTCHVVMETDKSVTATFTSITTKTLTIIASPSAGGTTDPGVGDHTYALNTGVDVTATAASGYEFTGWEGACTGTGACHITMDADKTLTANFASTDKTLTVAVSPTGGGTTSPSVGTHTYPLNTGVDITATPATGYEFTGWTGACTGTGTCHVTMDADKTVTANFVLTTKTLTVVVTPTGGGTASPAAGTHSYSYGTGVDVTALPATGYTFSGWAGACTGTGSCHVTMNDDKTVTANFTLINETLTVSASPSAGGTTSPAVGTHTYTYGTGVDVTASPADGYYLSSWSGACTGTGTCHVTMDADKTVTANFASATTTFTGTELLGRPEATSITVSAVPDTAVTLRYQYGTSTGSYSNQTTAVSATAGQPQVVTISGLTPNTKYFYRMQYSKDGGTTWVNRAENTFWTQRNTGSTFSFTITSDAHVNIMLGNATNWTNTLNTIKGEGGDFDIDLGDTAAMDNGTSSVTLGDIAAAEQKYKDTLPYFNIISGSSPIFLVAGNHEQQEAWHLQGTLANSLPIMGKNAEKKYFLNPVPDSFYSGDATTLADLSGDHLKQDYYAWTWGDALFIVISPYWTSTSKPYTTSAGGGESDSTGTGNGWDWTLGQTQFNWLKSTLQGSTAKYKFIFAHQLVSSDSLSGQENYGHGGVDAANLYEMGGYNVGGSVWGWDTNRSGWGTKPIHQLLVDNGVTAFFHGHDHAYAYEKMDGVVYQAVPSASFTGTFSIYSNGGNGGKTIRTYQNPGHLLVTVGPSTTTVDYIQSGSSSSTYSYTMAPVSTDKTLTVAVSPTGGGTTSPEVGTHTYALNSEVDITATPATGYTFTEWSGACTGTGTCHVTMDGDKTVTANFASVNKTLTVAVTPSGGGTTSPTVGTHTYTPGTGVDVTATAASGYTFTGWSGDCTGTGSCHVTMDTDRTVTANFTSNNKTLTVAVTPSGGGTTSPTVGTHTYTAGTGVDVTAAPADGYYLSSWSGDCTGTGTCHVTMDADKSVTANFASATTTFTGTELLGRPEATSITVSAVPDTAVTLRYQYGTSTGSYSNQTTAVSATAGQPQVVTISGLTPNTKYFYRMQYSKDGGTTWVNRAENSFWTQRSTGSTFSFTITSDAHVNIMLGNSTNWTNTLNTIKGEGGDFEIDLGDTAAMDNGTTSVALGDTAAAEQKYKDTLPYFNIISGSSPIFLVAGNHEQQEAWHLQGTLANSLPIMGKNAEKKYFLNPVPDSFYSGDSTTLADLSGDHLKQDYYAWTWGDALFIVISPYWTSTSKPYTTSTGGGETDATGTDNRWDWTLGQTQFNWLKSTLQGSTAKYKFVFAHQMVGGNSLTNQVNYGHGGVDSANLVEWGGYNVGGSVWGWDTNRSGWGTQPIGPLLEANNVTAFFHGHDHTFAYEKLNNVVYQAVPSASFTGNFNIYAAGGNNGKTIAVSQDPGHLLVTVGPDSTTVKYIKSGSSSVSYTYSMNPATVNNAPTNIALSSATIAENSASGSTVGSLTSTDPDTGNTFTYSLVTGTGDTDNSSFSITGNTLKTAAAFDFETKSSYTVRIRTTDQGSLYYEKAFTVTVTDVNEAPTNITLSPATVAENSAFGTTVGSLTAADPDTGNTFTYSLVSGTGGTDNSSFSITGNSLKTAAVFDYETKSSYSVRIRAADQGALNYEKAFTISVTNVNETPVAVDDTAGTNVNTALSITAATLKANDTDVDNSNAELSVTAVSNPTNGTANLTSGTITFTPTFDFVGTAGFDYTLSDGSLTDTGHVTITVSDLTFTLAVTTSGTGTGVVTSSDTFINCGSTCSHVYKNAHTVTLTATPTAGGYHRFAGWSGGGCTGTGTCVVSMTAARSVTANFEKATFADVPFDHPRWAYIQALYENGLTAGCSTDPLMFCPDKTMTRGESAAFLMRGLYGESYVPPAVNGIFTGDNWSDGSVSWAEKWAEALYNAKLTSGCGTDPLSFCPAKTTTRIEGATFGEALYHNGVGYTVPPATGTVFFDMTDTGFWGTKYAELAYADGLIPAWSVDPGSGKPIFSPDTLLDRSWAAYIIVKAKDLTLPE